MANSTNIPVADSAVYRGIYNELRNSLYQSSTEQLAQGDQGRFVDMGKWTFLQRLLAIEEAHDRKRMEMEKRNKERKSSIHKQERFEKTLEVAVPDLLSRWLHHQVLEDNPEESLSSDPDNRNQSHLPALNNVHQPGTCLFHSNKQTGALVSSPINEISENDEFLPPPVTIDDDSREAIENDRATSTPRLLRQTSIQEDDKFVSKPRRKRQLRLPPILLPRIYTITPRPLQCREFLTPTKIRGPITDEEWEDLKDCRYIRHTIPRFDIQLEPSNVSSIQS